MDGYDRLRVATAALSEDQLRNCVESLALEIYGAETAGGELVLTTDREWSDELVDGVIQVLADYGLHPDDLEVTGARAAFQNKRGEVGRADLLPQATGPTPGI